MARRDVPRDAVTVQHYLPALVFLALGAGIGALFVNAGRLLGPRRPNAAKQAPYESGMPSHFAVGKLRFGISFYLVAMMFLIFDLEVLLLFPVSVVLRDFGVHGLLAIGLFIGLLGIAFFYEWARGVLDWRD
jgi:NADH-quinone oxidoreductase subunit A